MREIIQIRRLVRMEKFFASYYQVLEIRQQFRYVYLPFCLFPGKIFFLLKKVSTLQISTTRRQSGHCLWQRVSLAEHEILQIQCGREQERERERERNND